MGGEAGLAEMDVMGEAFVPIVDLFGSGLDRALVHVYMYLSLSLSPGTYFSRYTCGRSTGSAIGEANADRRRDMNNERAHLPRGSQWHDQTLRGRIKLIIAQSAGLRDAFKNINTSSFKDLWSARTSPRPFPIVAEDSPVHLHSPALTPLPLVLDESQVLPSSLSLPFGQTGEITIVQLSHYGRGKLSLKLTESSSLDRLDVAARLLCLLDASLLGRALGYRLVKVCCGTLLGQRCFPARFCGEISHAMRFDAAGGFAGDNRWGGKEDDAAELVSLVALADFERDGEVGLVGENVGLDCRSLSVGCSCASGRTRGVGGVGGRCSAGLLLL